jgi:hypothetical protein
MTLDTNALGNWVRNFVHYDNLASSLYKQLQNARKVKDEFETRIINALQGHKMENAVIQIAGGRLLVGEEKHTHPLTLTRLEEYLHEYYRTQNREATDETAQILKFIKSQRGADVVKKLKKQTA